MSDRSGFAWTTGGDRRLSHKRLIDSGGSGVVHELYNSETRQVFARKLLRLGNAEPKTAKNELRSIKKLCSGEHPHIIQVFGFGDLPDASHVFIDMELCSLNLDQYNKSIRTAVLVHDSFSSLRIQEIWTIFTQIVILYSRVDGAWKVADFGLTTEGTSQRPLDTEFARGTPGYRALELLREQPTYTNKVDIWSLGCILYEMVVGSKLFTTDIAALDHYHSKSSVNVTFDDTFDEASQTELSEIIHETTQSNPLSRPTAQMLYERFSKKGVTPKAQSTLNQENPTLVKPTRPDAKNQFPVFRKMSVTKRLSVTGDHECAVVFTVVNMTGTRIGAVSCDVDTDTFRVNLWDVSSGNSLLELLYEGPEPSSRAKPTFSTDGGYFAVHAGNETVDIYDANTGSFIKSVEGPSSQISAIALSRYGKRVAMAITKNSDSTSGHSDEDDSAQLLYPGPGETQGMHIVNTYQITGTSLSYNSSGRYLVLVGGVLASKKRGEGDEISIWWDVMQRGEGKRQSSGNKVELNQWTTPLYDLPSKSGTFVRGYSICLDGGGVIGLNSQSLLILGAETDFQFWDSRDRTWFRRDKDSPVNPYDGTEYKYLMRYEGEGLEVLQHKQRQGTLFVAKLAWEDMPALFDVKAVMETEKGVALFLDGEKFVYFEKE